jgi:hypothetical protein
MDTAKARRKLGWRPRHDALHTPSQTIAAQRSEGRLRQSA